MDRDPEIRELLRASRVIAVVGLSADPQKPSNTVARYLMEKGYRVIPVNPAQESVLGQKSYKSVSEIEEEVDIVDIFMKADKLLPVVREALKRRPKAVWLQLGIVNEEARVLVEEQKVMFVMDRCVKQEHARLLQDPP